MRQLFLLFLVLTTAAPVTAGFWDYDTLRLKQRTPPGTLELIVGKFLRHSQAFYQWRVEDRRGRIAAYDDGALSLSDEELAAAFDDWAVALAKVGRRERALEVLAEKARRLPEVGRFRTLANRGTILIQMGRLREGIAVLQKARSLRPDTPLDREKYQVLLARYRLEVRRKEETFSLPLDAASRGREDAAAPFGRWLLEREGLVERPESQAAKLAIERALTGVRGMMRFGDFESPILLEALGDLLLSGSVSEHDVEMAVRAYLRAAMEADDESVQQDYRDLARQAAGRIEPDKGEASSGGARPLAAIEQSLSLAMKETRIWFEHLASDEALWVAKSTDPTPDERFWQKYGEQVVKVGYVRLPPAHYTKKGLPWPIQVAMGAIALLMVGVVLGMMAWRKRQPTGWE